MHKGGLCFYCQGWSRAFADWGSPWNGDSSKLGKADTRGLRTRYGRVLIATAAIDGLASYLVSAALALLVLWKIFVLPLLNRRALPSVSGRRTCKTGSKPETFSSCVSLSRPTISFEKA